MKNRKTTLISCFNTNMEDVGPQCKVSSSCSSAMQKVTVSTQNRPEDTLCHGKSRGKGACPAGPSSPCCRDLRTCGYRDPRGLACPHASPSGTSPSSSSSILSWKAKILKHRISADDHFQLSLCVPVREKLVLQDKKKIALRLWKIIPGLNIWLDLESQTFVCR